MSYSFVFYYYRAFVYAGFNLGKTVSQLHTELQQVFGKTSVSNLRTVRRWVADIRDGTFTLEKAGRSGRPRHTRTPDLVQKVEDFICFR